MEQKLSLSRILKHVVAYGAWLVASAAGFVDILLFRAAMNQLYILAHWEPDAFHFWDRLFLFLIGGVFLFVMILGEGYFVEAVERGDLRRRIVKVLGSEAVLAALLYVVPLLAAAIKS